MDPSSSLKVKRKRVRCTSAVQQRAREAKRGPLRKCTEGEVSCTLRSGGNGVLVGRTDIAFPGFESCFEHVWQLVLLSLIFASRYTAN